LRARTSPNFDARPAPATIDTLILHYTGMVSAEAALTRLCDPAAKVSAHYVIDEDGAVIALVPEELRAWHAGVSIWQGSERLNDRSIGIELVNPGHEFGYRPFLEPQYEACIGLCRDILDRRPIPARRVLAHSDVAPSRKQDPGELFDWQRLAKAGIGLWPARDGAGRRRPVADLQRDLARLGYGLAQTGIMDAQTRAVLIAFQRHFRPELIDGSPDPATLARLDALLALV
jgi:N-acetylmuramoyl-L-alanine amidase